MEHEYRRGDKVEHRNGTVASVYKVDVANEDVYVDVAGVGTYVRWELSCCSPFNPASSAWIDLSATPIHIPEYGERIMVFDGKDIRTAIVTEDTEDEFMSQETHWMPLPEPPNSKRSCETCKWEVDAWDADEKHYRLCRKSAMWHAEHGMDGCKWEPKQTDKGSTDD